jgi:hypothetical protein
VTEFFLDFTTHRRSADTHASGEYNFSFTSLHAWVAGITRCPHLHMNSRSTHHCTAGAQESRTCAISPSQRGRFSPTKYPGTTSQELMSNLMQMFAVRMYLPFSYKDCAHLATFIVFQLSTYTNIRIRRIMDAYSDDKVYSVELVGAASLRY